MAQMMVQAGISLGIKFSLLCLTTDEAAPPFVEDTTRVDDFNLQNLTEFVEKCDIVTFDHELVDPDLLEGIPHHETKLFPGPDTLRKASNKSVCRQLLADNQIPTPRFKITNTHNQLISAVNDIGYPCVAKASKGGYDGRGVFYLYGSDDLASLLQRLPNEIDIVVEPKLDISAELAILVVRNRSGDMTCYPALRTVQKNSICHEVSAPCGLSPEIEQSAYEIALKIAVLVNSIGILAVEMFLVDGQILINELAPRPHNSGHLTIEAAVTSQFENHLRGVMNLPLGSCELQFDKSAMVNIIGNNFNSNETDALVRALSNSRAHIHLYGKSQRQGRKLGHVTVTGTHHEAVMEIAREAILGFN